VHRIRFLSRVRHLLAWLVLAALPMQGFAAASMLFCGMPAQPAAQVHAPAPDHHDHAAHGHGHDVKADPSDGRQQAQADDQAHACGVCAACCHSAAIAPTPQVLALDSLPLAQAAEPFVRIHPRPPTVADKPPRS
jgi:cytochrome c553